MGRSPNDAISEAISAPLYLLRRRDAVGVELCRGLANSECVACLLLSLELLLEDSKAIRELTDAELPHKDDG